MLSAENTFPTPPVLHLQRKAFALNDCSFFNFINDTTGMAAGNESVGHSTRLWCCLLPDLRSYHNIFLIEISNTQKQHYLIFPFWWDICLRLPSSSCHGALPLLFFPSAIPLLWSKGPKTNDTGAVISDLYGIQYPNSNLSFLLHSLTSQGLFIDFTSYLVNCCILKVVFWKQVDLKKKKYFMH